MGSVIFLEIVDMAIKGGFTIKILWKSTVVSAQIIDLGRSKNGVIDNEVLKLAFCFGGEPFWRLSMKGSKNLPAKSVHPKTCDIRVKIDDAFEVNHVRWMGLVHHPARDNLSQPDAMDEDFKVDQG